MYGYWSQIDIIVFCASFHFYHMQAGTVWTNCWMIRDLNMPFGGMKASGLGREGAKESIEYYTEAKCICVKHC